MSDESKPLEADDLSTGVYIVHAWHALLRDLSNLPGQTLYDDAVCLINKLRGNDSREAYKTGYDDGRRLERKRVIEEVLESLSESNMEILVIESLTPTHFKKVDPETSKNIAFHYMCGAGDMSKAIRQILTKLETATTSATTLQQEWDKPCETTKGRTE